MALSSRSFGVVHLHCSFQPDVNEREQDVRSDEECTMTFDEVLAQVLDLLQREQRASYRGLKRRFALDDEYVEDLKEELIGAKRLAIDEDGRFLVWVGNAEENKGKWITEKGSTGDQEGEKEGTPRQWTPAH